MEEFNYRKTIPYQMKRKVAELSLVLQNGDNILEKRDELLEKLESKEFKTYLMNFGKACQGMHKRPFNISWFKIFLDVGDYASNVLAGLKAWKISGRDLPTKYLRENL